MARLNGKWGGDLFLASDDASYVTGTLLFVGGRFTAM